MSKHRGTPRIGWFEPPLCALGHSLQLHTCPCGPGCEYPALREAPR